jgi:hypothetical protein
MVEQVVLEKHLLFQAQALLAVAVAVLVLMMVDYTQVQEMVTQEAG